MIRGKHKHQHCRSRKPRSFSQNTTLEEMLQVKTFDELLKDGDVFNVQGAADKSGYVPKHIHRLCREERIPHITRGVDDKEVQFFFLAWQLKGLFQYKKVSRQQQQQHSGA